MTRFQPIQPDDLAESLAYLLATPGTGHRAPHDQVRHFLAYLEFSRLSWEGLRARGPTGPSALFLALLLPGSTAIIMIPTPGELGIDPALQRAITSAGLAAWQPRRLHYAQALLAPEARAQRRLLTELGFHPLAPLLYLERDATYPWAEPPPADAGTWVTFDATTYCDFATTLLATYEDSLDCPELTGLRPVEDIIAAHQSSGVFDPALWELLRVGDRSAACLLLARWPQHAALEVVYMGVVPAFRQRGLGSVLLRRALQRCRDTGARRLTLVVDERNQPARRLYDRFALRQTARRDAYLYRWLAHPARS